MPALRPPHGRAARGLIGMRRGITALLLVALLGLAGCGGSEIAADEVPGSPPTLSLPPDEEPAAAEDSGSNADSDSSSTEKDTGADTGATDDAATDTGSTGGTTAAPDTAATAAPEEAPATGGTEPEATAPESTGGAGGDEQQFEDFCNQNPGAC